jgi:prepilin-type N-terminal cleavage/methylation domain-containing protein
MYRRLRHGRGFSFIELLVVTSIVLVLAGGMLAQITIQRQRRSSCGGCP